MAFLLSTRGELECYAIVHPRNRSIAKRRASARSAVSLDTIREGLEAGEGETDEREAAGGGEAKAQPAAGDKDSGKSDDRRPLFPAAPAPAAPLAAGGLFGGGAAAPLTFGAGKLPGAAFGAKPIFGGFNAPPPSGGNNASPAASPFGTFATGGTGTKLTGFGSPPSASISSTTPAAPQIAFGNFASGIGAGTGFGLFNTATASGKPTILSDSSGNSGLAALQPPAPGEAKDAKKEPLAGATSSQFKPPAASSATDAKPVVKAAVKSTGGSSSAYLPMSNNAPAVFGAPAPAAATAGYPPMSGKAAAISGAPKQAETKAEAKAQAKPSGAPSAFPPMSATAPSVFGSQTKAATPVAATFGFRQPAATGKVETSGGVFAAAKPAAASAYPPLSLAAPSVFGGTAKPAASSASSTAGYPPMSGKAPAVFGAPKPAEKKAEAKQPVSSAYPPMSIGAPSVFGESTKATSPAPATFGFGKPAAAKPENAAAPKPTVKPSASSAYPPMSTNAPSVFGEAAKSTKPAAASSGYPPMSRKAPAVFGAPKSAEEQAGAKSTARPSTTVTGEASAYPPLSANAPAVFGAKAKPSAGYPPMSGTAPTVFGSATTSAAKMEAKPATKPVVNQPATSSAFPPLSTAAPAVFEPPKPTATSANVPAPPLFVTVSRSHFGASSPNPFGAAKTNPFGSGLGASAAKSDVGSPASLKVFTASTNNSAGTFGGFASASTAASNASIPSASTSSAPSVTTSSSKSTTPNSTAPAPSDGSAGTEPDASSFADETKRAEGDDAASDSGYDERSPGFMSPMPAFHTAATYSGGGGHATPTLRRGATRFAGEAKEWKQDLGEGDDEAENSTEFQVPAIPEMLTPPRSAQTRGREDFTGVLICSTTRAAGVVSKGTGSVTQGMSNLRAWCGHYDFNRSCIVGTMGLSRKYL